MKICLVGIPGVKPGKHNLKDPRLDQADKLVEASKKTYPQADVIGEENALDADAFLVTRESRADLILKDLEFVETRLSRSPLPAEQVVLDKIKTVLENDHFIVNAGLSPEELQAVAAHSFYTNKPIIVAGTQELEQPDHLLLRVFKEAGYISFLTVGGKENRAWEAGGAIHSDIQKGFIRAEIISFDDFISAGGETQAKRAGKQRLETKNYVMQDYDVVNFRFNK
jgi:hypothetical protein